MQFIHNSFLQVPALNNYLKEKNRLIRKEMKEIIHVATFVFEESFQEADFSK